MRCEFLEARRPFARFAVLCNLSLRFQTTHGLRLILGLAETNAALLTGIWIVCSPVCDLMGVRINPTESVSIQNPIDRSHGIVMSTNLTLPWFMQVSVIAAWASSRTAAICFSAWFTAKLLTFRPEGPLVSDVVQIVLSALFWLCAISVGGLAITFPATLILGWAGIYLVRRFDFPMALSLATGGFVAGTVIWSMVFGGAHPGAMIFGSWLAAPVIGGAAGLAAGWALSRSIGPSR